MPLKPHKQQLKDAGIHRSANMQMQIKKEICTYIIPWPSNHRFWRCRSQNHRSRIGEVPTRAPCADSITKAPSIFADSRASAKPSYCREVQPRTIHHDAHDALYAHTRCFSCHSLELLPRSFEIFSFIVRSLQGRYVVVHVPGL